MPEDEDRNSANRHTAYRQFVLWHHGRLGAGDRRTSHPKMLSMAHKFPDPFGQYIGFKTDRLQKFIFLLYIYKQNSRLFAQISITLHLQPQEPISTKEVVPRIAKLTQSVCLKMKMAEL